MTAAEKKKAIPAPTMTDIEKQALALVPDIPIRELLSELGQLDPYIWTVLHRRLRKRPLYYDVGHEILGMMQSGKPMTQDVLLRHRPFLIKPLLDTAQHKVYKKGRQVGVSELGINEVLQFLDSHPGTKWIYCVPDDAEIWISGKGFVPYTEVQPGDLTLTLDIKTGTTRVSPVKHIRTFNWEGTLSSVGPFHTTGEHRWPVIRDGVLQIVFADDVLSTDGLVGTDGVVYKAGDAQAKPRFYAGKVWCPETEDGTWFMNYRGLSIFTGNTFPRDTQLRDFSTTRFQEAIKESPMMRQLVGTPNQIYLKRIGDSFLILRSAWESGLGEGVDADGVTLDEKDRMNPGVETAFSESLQSSQYQLFREVSTPSLPGRGVDAPYQNSCQWTWHVKCEKCGEHQPVRFPDNVVQMKEIPLGEKTLEDGTYEYLCRKTKCRGKLNRYIGEWVAKYPSRTDISGYHMPQTIAVWQSATQLMRKKIRYKLLQPWQNYCLAECSEGDRDYLTDESFVKCTADYQLITRRTRDWDRVVAGIDWGHENWCIVEGVNSHNGRRYIIGFGYVEDSDRDPLGAARYMEQFLIPFEPDIIVADAGYGKDRNAYLLKRFENQLYACFYNPSEKHSRTFKPQFIDNSNKVLCDRTIALKSVCNAIREQDLGLPNNERFLRVFQKHLMNLAPIMVEDDETGDIYEVFEKVGDDHLAHCAAYCEMAMDKLTKGWGKGGLIC